MCLYKKKKPQTNEVANSRSWQTGFLEHSSCLCSSASWAAAGSPGSPKSCQRELGPPCSGSSKYFFKDAVQLLLLMARISCFALIAPIEEILLLWIIFDS